MATIPDVVPDGVLDRMIKHAQSQRRNWKMSLNEHVEGVQRALSNSEHWKQEEIELRLARARRSESGVKA